MINLKNLFSPELSIVKRKGLCLGKDALQDQACEVKVRGDQRESMMGRKRAFTPRIQVQPWAASLVPDSRQE